MSNGLYSGVAAMSGAQKRLEHIAQNIANAGTTAYKRRSSFTEALRRQNDDGWRRHQVTGTKVDFTQGSLERTGNPLHLGLSGPGWFAVETPRGEVYTRNGDFRMSVDGALVTPTGDPVAWHTRSGVFDPVGPPIVIDGEGQVRQGENALGRLRIVDFERPEELRQDGEDLWVAPARAKEIAAAGVVHQGSLERSNVNAMEELVELILIQRNFDSASNVVRSIDRSYRRLNQPVR